MIPVFSGEKKQAVAKEFVESKQKESKEQQKPLKDFLGEEFKGYKGQRAVDKLYQEKKGYIKNAFTRDDIGDITLVWGDENRGLCHIIKRRKENNVDIKEFLSNIGDVVEKGSLHKNKKNKNRWDIWYEGKIVIVETKYYNEDFTWIITGYKQKKEPKEKKD